MENPSLLFYGMGLVAVLSGGIFLTDKLRMKKSGAKKFEKYLIDQLETEAIPRFASRDEALSYIAKFQDAQQVSFGEVNVTDLQVLCDNVVFRMCGNGMIPEKDWKTWPSLSEDAA